jgi:hypothetical protein
MKLDHKKLVKLAAKYARSKGFPVVVTELSVQADGGYVEPDVIAWRSGGYSMLIECKASRSDFLADQKKPQRRFPGRSMGYRRWYCAPVDMLSRDDLPLGWGLLEVSMRGHIRETWQPVPKEYNARAEIRLLMSVVRRLGNVPGVRGVNVSAYTFKDIYGQDYESKNKGTLGVAAWPEAD